MAEEKDALFEKHHGELVQEASELASSCGADVAVLAFASRTGKAHVHHFAGARMDQKKGCGELMQFLGQDVEAMGLAEVRAFEGKLTAARASVLRRLRQIQQREERF